jgi:predicted S18 family serine protease
MGNFLSNLLKVVIVGGIAYGAYKFGVHEGEDKGRRSMMSDADKEEKDHLKDLIEELKQKKNKTKKDEYNLMLLESKLVELENY